MNLATDLDYARMISSERNIIPALRSQAEESDRLIWVFRKEILEWLTKLRRAHIDPHACDDFLRQGVTSHKYPIGYCSWIRDMVLNVLESSIPNLSDFVPECFPGSVKLRKIWAIKQNSCFNNAIQAGSWIIDVANDTSDTRKPPVVINRIEESAMRNPQNHADFCTVIEKCWWAQSYPNIYYPTLSPFFPVIFSSQGITGFYSWQTDSLDAGGIFNGFDSAYQFIFNSQFSEKRLADKQIKNLRQIGNHSPTVWSPSLRDIRSAFSLARRYGPNRLAEIYMWSLADVRKSTMELRV